MIIYLHGFRSAPASVKSTRLKSYMSALGLEDAFWCEQLPPSPRDAINLIDGVIRDVQRAKQTPCLIGSSLGGYYATWLAETHGLRAILVNPAVVAPLSLEAWVGPQTNLYTGETFDFTHQHLDELRSIDTPGITQPERYWLLAETGDEVLDYRHAVSKYQGARQTVLEGGDHGFSRWNDYLGEILEFAGVRTA